jgi:hypothetical protein
LALYKLSKYLHKSSKNIFDQAHRPGGATPFTGIYRCDNCGNEIASTAGHPLPPFNHAEHTGNKGAVGWRAIVLAESAE